MGSRIFYNFIAEISNFNFSLDSTKNFLPLKITHKTILVFKWFSGVKKIRLGQTYLMKVHYYII